jgi:hypothetical protein
MIGSMHIFLRSHGTCLGGHGWERCPLDQLLHFVWWYAQFVFWLWEEILMVVYMPYNFLVSIIHS